MRTGVSARPERLRRPLGPGCVPRSTFSGLEPFPRSDSFARKVARTRHWQLVLFVHTAQSRASRIRPTSGCTLNFPEPDRSATPCRSLGTIGRDTHRRAP